MLEIKPDQADYTFSSGKQGGWVCILAWQAALMGGVCPTAADYR